MYQQFTTYCYDTSSSVIKEHTEDWGEVAKECSVLHEKLNRQKKISHTCMGMIQLLVL